MSQFRCVCLYCLLLLTFVFACGYAFGQSDPDEISQVLGEEILAPSAALHQIKSLDYLYNYPNVYRNRVGITGLSAGDGKPFSEFAGRAGEGSCASGRLFLGGDRG